MAWTWFLLRVGVMSSVVPVRAGPTRPHRVSRYRQVCAEQAAYAPSGARVCPPLISDGHLKVLDAAPFSKRRGYPGGSLADVSSASLSELAGEHIATNGGHWHYDVSWTPAVHRLLVRNGTEHSVQREQGSCCRQQQRARRGPSRPSYEQAAGSMAATSSTYGLTTASPTWCRGPSSRRYPMRRAGDGPHAASGRS